ncbi:MAG: hypothetical protein A2293_10160 [Elusimicrobia bacterium RIFOXYB2_FULL_49_7]|nr:MAG: hypothetical protein A2293_10160 [Elusimicrobia bacterium RIFOXYB2_FULL_49_7]
MSTRLLEIERKAFKLPGKEREILAEHLIQSLDDMPFSKTEEAWVREAEKRFNEYKRGIRQGIPASRAFRLIRQDLGWSS